MRNRWLILGSLFLVRTVGGIVYQSVASAAPALMADLGINFAQLGVLLGLYTLPAVALSVPAGLLGKRFGDKRVVMAGLGLMTVGGLIMSHGNSYALVCFGRLLTGIGTIPLDVSLAAMVADWFAEKEIVTAMATLVSSWPFGLSLGLIVLGPLMLAQSWQQVMRLTAALCLAGLMVIAATYRPPPGIRKADDAGSLRFTLSRQELTLAALAGLIWALFNVGFVILPNFVPGFLTVAGYTLSQAGALVSVVTWLVIPSLPIGGYIAERIGRPNATLVFCFLGIGLAMFAIPLARYPLGWFVVLGLLFGPPAGIILALPVEVLLPVNRPVGMGMFFSCAAAANATMIALAGLSRDATQRAEAPILYGGALFFVALLVLWLFRTVQMRSARVAT